MLARIIRTIQEKLGLTKSEAAILLFLSLSLILGGSVKMFHLDRTAHDFDFTASDEFFAAASAKIDSILAYEEDSLDNSIVRKAGATPEADVAVNINLATIDELTALPGVGRATARRIIDYRTANGRFNSADELLNVKGIGKKKLEQMRPHVRVE